MIKLQLHRAVLITMALAGVACDSNTKNQPESSDPQLAIGAANSTDFVAVRVEAENYSDFTGGWTLTSPGNIPNITPDPDPPHFSTASNDGYVELLPDTRVTHDDELINGQNYWPQPGGGPRLEYNIVVPEPGRYYVFVKAYSTGPEDNGIHVGLNNERPNSGKRIQLCSGKNRWTWSSAQRVETNHCGVEKTIFLDIDTAGSHTITFHAREDGYELDQFLLLKDVNESARSCFPLASDKIRCVDVATGDTVGNYILPTTPTTDGNEVIIVPPPPPAIVDLSLNLSVNNQNVYVADEISYTLKIKNTDNDETATNVVSQISLPTGLNFVGSDLCTGSGQQLSCNFSEISSGQQLTATFSVVSDAAGKYRVDAQVTADQQETSLDNNTDSVEVSATVSIPDYDGMLSVLQGPNAAGVDSHTANLVLIKNIGLQEITNATLDTSSSNSAQFSSTYAGCTGDTNYSCTIDTIAAGATVSVPLTMHASTPGLDNISVTLNVAADADEANNSLSIPVYVVDNTMVTGNNGVVTLEAESFVSQSTLNDAPFEGAYNSAWFINSAVVSPTVLPDFDSVAPDETSNSSYVEFLPDTRLGYDDAIIMNVSNYLNGGQSAYLTYNVFFKEAGRYHISALIRANNDQDAAIHIGINDQWPQNSSNITVCTPNGSWQWTNSLKCNHDENAYIDIDKPGSHQIHTSAATDGVELDKLSFDLNTSDLPEGLGGNPEIFVAENIDLGIDNRVTGNNYIIELVNYDTTAPASAVVVQLQGIDLSLAESITGFDGCTTATDHIECNVDFVAANSSRTASVTIEKSDSTLSATLVYVNDTMESNNTSSTSAKGGGSLSFRFLFLLLAIGYIRIFTSLKPK